MPNRKPVTVGFIAGGLVLAALVAWTFYGLLGNHSRSVIRVNKPDPALQKAIDQARSGLDGFITRLSHAIPGQGFAVKGKFATDAGPEYLWVRTRTYAKNVFSGTLDQQPIAFRDHQKGDEIQVAKKDVVDWLVKDGDHIDGMFTEKVLQGSSPNK